jgi:membrane protein DedA with SNARE-associated domain/membrane-associated phospholipid phosphatase
MEHAYLHLLQLLAGHPVWTLAVIFLAAFLEAVAVIGTVIPGTTTMFFAGALVGTGSLNLWAVFACAIAGAVAGDGMSYWLGAHYKTRIVLVWPLRTHPQLLDKGHEFFAKHGAKSVVFARFAGPIRAIVPVVAGMSGMAPVRFYAMNVLSALLWAPAHILPGVVFGASVQLAGAVSFRLVVVIALLVGIRWLSFRLARLILSHAGNWVVACRRWLVTWASRRTGRASHIARRILDPEQPASRVMTMMSLLVLLSGWVFLSALEDVISGDPLVRVDVSVYHFLQSIRTPWGDTVLLGLATLGSVTTLTALVFTTAALMIWERRWRTLGYWLAAVGFSQLLVLAIQFAIHRAPPGAPEAHAYVFPSNHVAATVIVYGFLAFLLARRVGRRASAFIVTISTAIVVLVAFAGLYFGRFWFSDAIGGAALGSVWVAILALTVVWHERLAPPLRGSTPIIVLVVTCGAVAVQLGASSPVEIPDIVRNRPAVVVAESEWTGSLWKALPCYRSDLEGDRKEPLTIQLSASAQDLKRLLLNGGWVEGPGFSARSLFSLVSPNVSAMALPVLPKLTYGEPSPLVFARPGATSGERDVIRFWPSGYSTENQEGSIPTPIWVSSITHERLYRPSWPLNMLHADEAAPAKGVLDELFAGQKLTVLGKTDCDGIAVTLVALSSR